MYESSSIIIPKILAPVLIFLVSICAYYFIYKGRINRAVMEGIGFKHKMLSPGRFAVILIIGILLTYAAYMSVNYINSKQNSTDLLAGYRNGYYNFKVNNKSDMEGYLSVYSIDSNPGYTKYNETKGDISFTYFIRDDEYDTYHPSFLVFVQYAGQGSVKNYGYNGKFLTYTEDVIGGFGSDGQMEDEYFVVVGDASISCNFSLQVALYDTDYKYEKLGDGSIANETLVFYIP